MERRVERQALAETIIPLTGSQRDHDALFAMIGEATHGTHEFYHMRAELTKRLIVEHGFTGVCIEGDWPDAYRINRFVRGAGDDSEAVESLGGFRRFPGWMWRNSDVLDFIGWLRAHNDNPATRRGGAVGFYGLDLYSMCASIEAVLTYLDRVDPVGADNARKHYACLSMGGSPRTNISMPNKMPASLRARSASIAR